MTVIGWAQIALFCVVTVAITRPVGGFMTSLADGGRTFLWWPLRPVERAWYWVCGVDETREQSWIGYAVAMMLFKLVAFLFCFSIIRLQPYLPFNPDGQGPVSPDLAFNTAVSFVTNTNWQSYGGETTMSYFTQMAALTVQNFASAAAGIALAFAVIRGFSRRSAKSIGNFWVDMTRITVYLLLPFSIVLTIFYVWQGMPQTLAGHVDAVTLEGAKQAISVGPVASQEAIKILGTNGGGFFNVNSAHPFENPNALTNMLQVISIFVLGAGLTNVFGRMVKDERQGWAVFAAMGLLFLVGVAVVYWSESHGNPFFAQLGVDPALGNMEGKEVRFGASASALFATATTDASCGAVNSMHESFLPLGGMIPMINIMLGEIIFGGVGSGLYGFVLFAIVAVFVAGLMVGRTPEYIGKKLEAREIKMTMLAILCLPLSMLGFTAIAVVLPGPLSAISAPGPHGFSEALYAYVSATGNNGSAFAGLSANTPYWNTTLGLAMIIGRFIFVIPALAVAGSLAAKKTLPPLVGYVSHARPAVRRAGRGRDPDRRRSDLLPRLGARPRRRALRHEQRHAVLRPEAEDTPVNYVSKVDSPAVAKRSRTSSTLLDPRILLPAVLQSLVKLDPRTLWRNPVMFVVEVVSILTTILLIRDALTGAQDLAFAIQINIWLWFTVLFANFAEAVAEGRGKAQAASLRRAQTEVMARREIGGGRTEVVAGTALKQGDVVVVVAGDLIPSDGEIIEGVASVNEGGHHRRVRPGDPRGRR